MLDTKLRKTHRLTNLIITLVVLIPALVLVALYPQMEKAALAQKKVYAEAEMAWRDSAATQYDSELADYFDNMATEAAYYIYGCLLREAKGQMIDMSVLEEYGWINDYYAIRNATDFYAELTYYTDADTSQEETTSDENDTVRTQGENTSEESVPVEDLETVEDVDNVTDIGGADAPKKVDIEKSTLGTEDSVSKDNLVPVTYVTTNADWDMSSLLDMSESNIMNQLSYIDSDAIGFITLEFNSYGELADVNVCMQDGILAGENYYSSVTESMDQFRENATYWDGFEDTTLVPKDFRVIFLLKDTGEYVWSFDLQYYSSDWQSLYLDTGAIAPVLVFAVLVALAALLLPFIKKLETGREKLFCMPFEVVLVICVLGALGACGMFMLMTETNMTNVQAWGRVSIIGIDLGREAIYSILLFVNFCGWAICFFAEYIVVASIRQFFCNPKQYLKERIWCVRILRWLKVQLKRFADYLMDIDIHDKMHSNILKIVLVNFVCVTLFCCLWWFGIIGVVIYTVMVYIILRKFGDETREKYEKVLDAAKQMADGNLKFTLEEDLGMFTPIGQELEKVQQGFSKAVIEEAKSQNMKTELITNVSHDLKTPLTAIITYIELLKKEDLTEEERKSYIATIDQKSQRLKVLIEDLFEISKASSGNIQMNFMDVDVVNLMKQVRLEMEEKIIASDLIFKWNLPEERLVLSLDGQKTYRIFENLLNNVLKYSLPHSRVYVDVVDLKTHVQITFRNISAVELNEDPSHLTDRFVRGDASRQTEGSGLGLAIVKSFVELQHGKLDISIDGDLFKVSIVWQK